MTITQNCSICLDPLTSYTINLHPQKSDVNLHHIFHRTCIDLWIQNHHHCPLCRERIQVLESQEIIRQREDRLLSAVENHDLDDVKHVLRMGFLSTSTKIHACLKALNFHQPDLLNIFFDTTFNYKKLMPALLTNISRSAHYEHLEMLIDGKFATIQDREYCVTEAAKGGQIDFIKLVINKYGVTEEALGTACLNAIDFYFSDAVPKLLEMGNIPYLARTEAVIKLVKRKDFFLVKFLLFNGPITEVARARVLVHAKIHQNQDLIQLLDRGIPFFQMTYDQALIQAYEEQVTKEVLYYLQHRLVTSELVEVLLERVVEHNQLILIEKVLKYARYDANFLHGLKQTAINRGYVEMTQILQSQIKWSAWSFLQQLFGII